MSTNEITNTNATLAPTDTLRVRADQPESWRAYGAPRTVGARNVAGARALTWGEAREIIARADAADGVRRDVPIGNLAGWMPCPTADGTIGLIPAGNPNAAPIPMRGRAFAAWCREVGAPADFILSLSHKIATAAAFDASRRNAAGGYLLRCAGGEARALVSDRYAPFDNGAMLDTVERALSSRGLLDAVQVRAVATGLTTSMRVTLPVEIPADVRAAALARPDHAWVNAREGRSDAKGSPIEIGFDLRNGEIGNRSLGITPVTVRLVCLNGLTREDREATTRLRHTGDHGRKAGALADAIFAALDLASGLRERQIVAGERLIDDAMRELGILESLGFSQTDARGALAAAYAAEHGVAVDTSVKALPANLPAITIGDLMNGATLYAQAQPTDKRLDLEAAAGAYVLRRAA